MITDAHDTNRHSKYMQQQQQQSNYVEVPKCMLHSDHEQLVLLDMLKVQLQGAKRRPLFD